MTVSQRSPVALSDANRRVLDAWTAEFERTWDAERLASWVAAGSVIPPPITRLSLDEVAALLSQDSHTAGKTVITM